MPLIPSGVGNIASWAWARGWSKLQRSSSGLFLIAGTIGCCVVLQFLLLLLVGSNGTFHDLQTRTALQLEVLPAATDQDISSLYAALRQHPAVEDVQYATRQQVYERQRAKDPSFIAFLEKFQLENPFPDTLSVVVRSVNDYRVLEEFLQQESWHRVVDPQFLTHTAAAESDVRTMLDVLRAARFTLALLLLVGVVGLAAMVGRALEDDRSANVGALLGANAAHMLAPSTVAAGMLLLIGVLASALVAGIGGLLLLSFLPGDSAGGFLREQMIPLLTESAPSLLLIEMMLLVPVAILAAVFAARAAVPAPSLLQWGTLPLPRRA